MIKNIRVGVRLGAAFTVVVLLLLVVSVTAVVKIKNINSALDQMMTERYLKVRLAFEVRDGLDEQIKYLRGIVIDTARPAFNKVRYTHRDESARKTQVRHAGAIYANVGDFTIAGNGDLHVTAEPAGLDHVAATAVKQNTWPENGSSSNLVCGSSLRGVSLQSSSDLG